jgi:2-dehydro-3-deoxyphosphogluconate aldolase/(4S)-4-hydroxy-2-oxoglutarate aldolase
VSPPFCGGCRTWRRGLRRACARAGELERCRALGVPAIPGALTPTEIEAAGRLGAALVKLFPAVSWGPAVREALAPLAGVELIVTGGVNLSNARPFIEAGAVAVGVGSSLTGALDVESQARKFIDQVLAATSSS